MVSLSKNNRLSLHSAFLWINLGSNLQGSCWAFPSPWKDHSRGVCVTAASERSITASLAMGKDGDDSGSSQKIKVLALHGSGGTADSFAANVLEKWNGQWPNIDLDVTSVQGHVSKDTGFAWWKLQPGERSSTVTTFDGFEASRAIVQKAADDTNDGFDLVVGHSQGAILTTALLAVDPQVPPPSLGYILNGVAWPNPFTKELESSSFQSTARVLLLVGLDDTINRPEQAFRVQEALERAGCDLTIIAHSGGHAVPTKPGDTMEKIQAWVESGAKTKEDGTNASGES